MTMPSIARFLLPALGLTLLLAAVACDDLVTEVNEVTRFDPTLGEDCLRCHADNSDFIIQPKGQWENSAHASPDLIELHANLNGEQFWTNQCGAQCHTSQGYIDFIAGQPGPDPDPATIQCYTCHMPHTGDYGTWRVDTLRGDQDLIELSNGEFFAMGQSNMCVHCHQAVEEPAIASNSAEVTLTGDWGPHFSAQADFLGGSAGFDLGGLTWENTHDTVAAQDGCLSCHFGEGVGYDFGEHTFRLEDDQTGEQFVANCNTGGACHGSGAVTEITDFYAGEKMDSIRFLADTLENYLKYRLLLDPADGDGRTFFADSTIPGIGAKILYNYLIFKLDGSEGVHNPDYALALLTQSLDSLDAIPPVAIFTADIDTGCAPQTVNFTDDSRGNITGWTWDFGDGNQSTQQNPTHVYDSGGTYDVTLAVTGPAGDDSETKSGFIAIVAAPVAEFEASDSSVCQSADVTFTDLTTGAVDTWEWDFGDGNTSTEQNPTHTYAVDGDYTVTLAVSGPCGADTLSKAAFIQVRGEVPGAEFAASDSSICSNETVTFTDLSTGGVTEWLWDFGDGNQSTEQNPTHQYADSGLYTVSLTVSGPCGDSTVTKADFIDVQLAATADFEASDSTVCTTDQVAFTNLTVGDADTYLWDFGDGTTSTAFEPSHQYTVAGVYTVSLQVTSACGSDTAIKTDFITVGDEAPIADFAVSDTTACLDDTLTFVNLTTGDVTTYEWDFGDLGTSNEVNPQHVYPGTGTFTVQLVATGPCGVDTATLDVTITQPPENDFLVDPGTSGCDSLTVTFTNTTNGVIDSTFWDFGDGATSTEFNPTHTYIGAGSYTVTMITWGPCGSDTLVESDLITIDAGLPTADFTATPTSGTANPLQVQFTSLATNARTHFWDFGDGGSSTSTNPSHPFAPGTWTVTLTVTNACGQAEEVKVDYIVVTAPAPESSDQTTGSSRK